MEKWIADMPFRTRHRITAATTPLAARIDRLAYALDLLHSKWSQKGVKHRKRRRMRKAGARASARIHQLVQDLHEAKFLCANFSIILPKFQTSTIMIRLRKRKFKARTARALATWSHYCFQQRLLQKSREYPWCRVIIVNEAYASKTCEVCGQINSKLEERHSVARIVRCAVIEMWSMELAISCCAS